MSARNYRIVRSAWWAALVVVCVALLATCRGGATHTVATDTSFYLDGPQQARSPDGTLAAGTRVTLVRVAGSYAEVTMPDGRRAYIAADSLITIGTTPRK
jgi:hypothetical protein